MQHNAQRTAEITAPTAAVADGAIREYNGKRCIYYDGYWIRYYEVPSNEDSGRRELIEQLTKRVFHHSEPGINTPGYKLQEARQAYLRQNEPQRRRVNAAMLAGALLNRGSDIFNILFELRQRGIEVQYDNELLRECEACFLEAFELGKQVRHYSGEEGLDELWGEPLKVFYMPLRDFFESRYIKIAQSMACIDQIAGKLTATFGDCAEFPGVGRLITAYAAAAKIESETMKTDPAIFQVWPEFVATGDELFQYEPPRAGDAQLTARALNGLELIREGKKIIEWVAFARVPMPKTAQNFLARCDAYLVEERESQK